MFSSFIKNSGILMIDSAVNMGGLALFWLLAARYIDPINLGVAQYIISFALLTAQISRLGLDFSIVHFYPKIRHGRKLVLISMLIIFIMTVFFWSVISNFILQKQNIGETFILGLLTSIAFNLVTINSSVFLAIGKYIFQLRQTFFISLIRLILIIILIWCVNIGDLVLLWMIPLLIVGIPNLFLSLNKYEGIAPGKIEKFLVYSVTNYFASIFSTTFLYLMPIIVMWKFGPEKTAIYSIIFMIYSGLNSIYSVNATNLFSTSSRDLKSVFPVLKKLIPISMIFQLLVVIIFYTIGKPILFLINPIYQSGYILLILLLIAGFPSIINEYLAAIYRGIPDNRKLLTPIVTGNIVVLLSIFIVGERFGLAGVGISWMLGQLTALVINFFSLIKYQVKAIVYEQ